MTRDELEARFVAKTLRPSGGLLLLGAADAKDLIREAAKAGIAILGVDGMLVRATETLSPLEHIADFSPAYRRGEGCWKEAERFIDERRSLGLVFEVTLGEHLDLRYNERCN
jgi:hypothetical protein